MTNLRIAILLLLLVRPSQVPPGIDGRTGRAFEPLDVMFPVVPSVGVTLEF